MSPKVSIVMSVYNGEVYVAESINSMLNQTFADFEFIILDDGSTDATLGIIQEFAKHDDRIQIIKLDTNMGLAAALNRGIAVAQGQYIARMDADDVSLPERLQKQVDFLDAHPDVGVVGTQMQVVDQDKKPLFKFVVPQQHSLIVWNIFFGRTFAHPSVLMRRDAVNKVGGYDATLPVAQDIDLWSQLVGQVKFANLADSLMLYRTHERATSVSRSEQQRTILAATSKRLLTTLWGEVSDATIDDFLRVRSGQSKFTLPEMEHMSALMTRLTRSLLDVGWIESDEVPLLLDEMKRRLNYAPPDKKGFLDRWLRWR